MLNFLNFLLVFLTNLKLLLTKEQKKGPEKAPVLPLLTKINY